MLILVMTSIGFVTFKVRGEVSIMVNPLYLFLGLTIIDTSPLTLKVTNPIDVITRINMIVGD